MPHSSKLIKMKATTQQLPTIEPVSLKTYPLTEQHNEAEILAFLAERPLHTVVMSSFIRDNGLENPFNRGTFYACRDEEGSLQGVALIGHAMFVEARSAAALSSFAQLAQQHQGTHMIMGEQETVQRFWGHYAGAAGQPPRLFSREVLFEQRWPVETCEPVHGLRPATLDDLMMIMPVHAALAYEESGINPLDVDMQGFRLRCARRIEQGRVWVLAQDDDLVFKADIVAETPDCIYLEGVYVNALERRKGYGTRCLTQLARTLLGRTKAISALVNEQNGNALALFHKSGYKARGYYETIFLQQKRDQETGAALVV